MTPQTQAVLYEFHVSREALWGGDIAERTKLPQGTVYPILQRLLAAGWLSDKRERGDAGSKGRRLRRYYRLTAKGKKVVAGFFAGAALGATGSPLPLATPPSLPDPDASQDLIYQAWESGLESERARLARQALRLDMRNSDAYNVLGSVTHDPVLRVALYQQGWQVGLERYGELLLSDKEWKWGTHKLRPALRSLNALADAYFDLGAIDLAAECADRVLEIMPQDNLGMRYLRTAIAFTQDDKGRLRQLMHYMKDDSSAHASFDRVLYALLGEHRDRAEALLKDALHWNIYVPSYLLGELELPEVRFDSYSLGFPSEAIDYARLGRIYWQRVPGALDWLANATLAHRRRDFTQTLRYVDDLIGRGALAPDDVPQPVGLSPEACAALLVRTAHAFLEVPGGHSFAGFAGEPLMPPAVINELTSRGLLTRSLEISDEGWAFIEENAAGAFVKAGAARLPWYPRALEVEHALADRHRPPVL